MFLSEMTAQITSHWLEWLGASLAVAGAYAMFTLVGFGSAMLASAPLAMVMPVARVVPVLALLDCGGSAWRAWTTRQAIVWPALRQLLPGMLLGQLSGVYVLSQLPLRWMALALGGFVVVQGLRGLVLKVGAVVAGSSGHALLRGCFGGVLGGLFGSGGFVYASYLERTLSSREAFRATQGVLIALSTAWRILLCAGAGLMDAEVFVSALLLLPCALVGGWLARHIDLRLERGQLFRLLNAMLILAGTLLVLRFC